MALNHAIVFDNTYPLPAPATVDGGEVFVVGGIVAVAQYPATQGEIAGAPGLQTVGYLNGIHRFTAGTGAITVGQPVYITTASAGAGTLTVTTTAAAGTFIGYAVEPKASAAGPVWVLIQQGAPKVGS